MSGNGLKNGITISHSQVCLKAKEIFSYNNTNKAINPHIWVTENSVNTAF